MSDALDASYPDFTPEQRRRNLVLGLLLGGFVLASIVAFMASFSRNGLPKSPSEVKRREARAQAEARDQAEAPGQAGPALPASTPAPDPSAELQPR